MFYRPADGHPLAHNPFNALIVPRPIAWISTRGRNGVDNLAPYSFFNGAAYDPPQVMFASTGTKDDRDGTKDSVANIRETGVFCVNLVETAMQDAMNATSATLPAGVSEFDHADILRVECDTIDCVRIANAPATMECKMSQITPIAGTANFITVGEVTGIHIRDDCIVDGMFDVTKFRPLARLGYRDYTTVETTHTLARPDD